MSETLEKGVCPVCGSWLAVSSAHNNTLVCPRCPAIALAAKTPDNENDSLPSEITLRGEVSAGIIAMIDSSGARKPLRDA